jgi:superfamily I DNA/RNA helicase
VVTFLRAIYDLCIARRWKFFEGLAQIENNPGLIDKYGTRVSSAVTAIRQKLPDIYTAPETDDDKTAAMNEAIERAVNYVTVDTAEREALLKELREEIERSKCSSLAGLLSAIAVQTIGEGGVGLEPGVHILSMHKAKGLSADFVFIPVAEDHQLPGVTENKHEELEALRLLFVSITRAKENVIFSFAARRTGAQQDHETHRPRKPALTPFLKDTGLRKTDHRKK